jgi:hypothetical protein
MIANLKFKLPEEQEQFDLAINGSNYFYVLQDLYEYIKEQTNTTHDEKQKVYAEIQVKFRSLLNEQNIPI